MPASSSNANASGRNKPKRSKQPSLSSASNPTEPQATTTTPSPDSRFGGTEAEASVMDDLAGLAFSAEAEPYTPQTDADSPPPLRVLPPMGARTGSEGMSLLDLDLDGGYEGEGSRDIGRSFDNNNPDYDRDHDQDDSQDPNDADANRDDIEAFEHDSPIGSGSLNRTIRAPRAGGNTNTTANANAYVPVPMPVVRRRPPLPPQQGYEYEHQRQSDHNQQEFERGYEKEDDFAWGGMRGGQGEKGVRGVGAGYGYGQEDGERHGYGGGGVNPSLNSYDEEDEEGGVRFRYGGRGGGREAQPHSRGSGSGSGLAQAMRRLGGGSAGVNAGAGAGASTSAPLGGTTRTAGGGGGYGQERVVLGGGGGGGGGVRDRARVGSREANDVVNWSKWGVLEARRILTIAYHQSQSSTSSSPVMGGQTHIEAQAGAGAGPGLQIYDCSDLGSIKELMNLNLDGSVLGLGDAAPASASVPSSSRQRPRKRTRTKIIDVAVLPTSSPEAGGGAEEGGEEETPLIGILLESSTTSGGGVHEHEEVEEEEEGQRQRQKQRHHETLLVVYSLRTHRVVRRVEVCSDGDGGGVGGIGRGRCVPGCRIAIGGRTGKEGVFGVSTTNPPTIHVFSSRTFRVVYTINEEDIMGFGAPTRPLGGSNTNLTTSGSNEPGLASASRQGYSHSHSHSHSGSGSGYTTQYQQRHLQQHFNNKGNNRNFDDNNVFINDLSDVSVLPGLDGGRRVRGAGAGGLEGRGAGVENGQEEEEGYVDDDDDEEEEESLPYPVFTIHGRLLAYACVSPFGATAGASSSSIAASASAPGPLSPSTSVPVPRATVTREAKDLRRLSSTSTSTTASHTTTTTTSQRSRSRSNSSGSRSGLSSALSGIGAGALGGLGAAAGRLGLGGFGFASGLGLGMTSVVPPPQPGTRFVSRSAPADDGRAYLGLEKEKERERGGKSGGVGGIKPSRSAGAGGVGGGGGGYFVRVLDLDVGGRGVKTTRSNTTSKTRIRIRHIALFPASRSQPVSSLEFTQDGMSLGVGSRDGRWVKVFRIEVGLPGVVLSSASVPSPAGDIDPNTAEVEELEFAEHNLRTPTQTYELFRGRTNAHVHCTSFTSDGMYAGLGTTNGTVHIFAVNPPQLHLGGVGDVRWHLEGRVRDVEGLEDDDATMRRKNKATQVKALARLKTAKTAPSTQANLNVPLSPSPISPVVSTSPFGFTNDRDRSSFDKDGIGSSIAAAPPLAFTFVSHADLALSPGLLPSSHASASSSYRVSSSPLSPSSAHAYGHRTSSYSPSYPSSSSATQAAAAGKNWQDVLIFDPSSGVLSLRRLWLDKRVVRGDALSLGGISSALGTNLVGGLGTSLGGIGSSLGGIGNSLALGGTISGISGTLGNSLGGIGSSSLAQVASGIGGGVVNAMTSISLPKMSSLSAYVGAGGAGGASSLAGYSPVLMGYGERTKERDEGRERAELVASESVVAVWSLGRRRGAKVGMEDVSATTTTTTTVQVVKQRVMPAARPTTSTTTTSTTRITTAGRTAAARSPANYLSHTEITTHHTPPSTSLSAVVSVSSPSSNNLSNSKNRTADSKILKPIYLSHQFSFSSYTSSTAGDIDGEDYHALIRGYQFEALQGIGRRLEVRKEVEVVLAGGLGLGLGSPVRGSGSSSAVVVEEEEELFVYGSSPRDIGHRRASSSSATSTRLHMRMGAPSPAANDVSTPSSSSASADPLASAISSSLNDEGDYYSRTFGGRRGGVHQPQLPMWPNGAPGAYTTTTIGNTSVGAAAGPIRGVKGIGEGLGKIGRRISASASKAGARSGRGPAPAPAGRPGHGAGGGGGEVQTALEFNEFDLEDDEHQNQQQQRYGEDEFEDDFMEDALESYDEGRTRQGQPGPVPAHAHAPGHRRTPNSVPIPLPGQIPVIPVPVPVMNVVDMDADVLGTVDEELWGSSSTTSVRVIGGGDFEQFQSPSPQSQSYSAHMAPAHRDRGLGELGQRRRGKKTEAEHVSWDTQDRQAVVDAEGYEDLEVEKLREAERVARSMSLVGAGVDVGTEGGGTTKKGKRGKGRR